MRGKYEGGGGGIVGKEGGKLGENIMDNGGKWGLMWG